MSHWKFTTATPDMTVYFPTVWTYDETVFWIIDRIFGQDYNAYSEAGKAQREVNLYRTEPSK